MEQTLHKSDDDPFEQTTLRALYRIPFLLESFTYFFCIVIENLPFYVCIAQNELSGIKNRYRLWHFVKKESRFKSRKIDSKRAQKLNGWDHIAVKCNNIVSSDTFFSFRSVLLFSWWQWHYISISMSMQSMQIANIGDFKEYLSISDIDLGDKKTSSPFYSIKKKTFESMRNNISEWKKFIEEQKGKT